jgi:hypothetical protein
MAGSKDAPGAEGGYDEGLSDDGDLGEVARAGLGDVGEDGSNSEGVLDGMEYNTNLAFLGMGYRTNDSDYKLGQEVEFHVRGRIVQVGDQLMKDDHQRHIVKVDVQSVTIPE